MAPERQAGASYLEPAARPRARLIREGFRGRTLAPAVPPDSAEARLLPGEGVAKAAAHRRSAGQELGVGPPVQRSDGRRLSLAAAGTRGGWGRRVGVAR